MTQTQSRTAKAVRLFCCLSALSFCRGAAPLPAPARWRQGQLIQQQRGGIACLRRLRRLARAGLVRRARALGMAGPPVDLRFFQKVIARLLHPEAESPYRRGTGQAACLGIAVHIEQGLVSTVLRRYGQRNAALRLGGAVAAAEGEIIYHGILPQLSGGIGSPGVGLRLFLGGDGDDNDPLAVVRRAVAAAADDDAVRQHHRIQPMDTQSNLIIIPAALADTVYGHAVALRHGSGSRLRGQRRHRTGQQQQHRRQNGDPLFHVSFLLYPICSTVRSEAAPAL